MSGITNKDLEKLCRKFLNKNFLGVYPCDAFPISKKDSTSVIFNLSKHDEEGSHFIAIAIRKSKIIYFDSFGKKCENKYISDFLNKFNLSIESNIEQIQHEESALCGYFCFYFLYICFLQNKSLQFFIKKFKKNKNNLLVNNKKLLNYILKIIK